MQPQGRVWCCCLLGAALAAAAYAIAGKAARHRRTAAAVAGGTPPPLADGGDCAAPLAARGGDLAVMLQRAGAPQPRKPPSLPLRPVPPPQPSQLAAGLQVHPVARGTVRLRNVCVRAHAPFQDVLGFERPGESYEALTQRLLNESQGQIVPWLFGFDFAGNPLPKRRERVGLALKTPEDVFDRITELRLQPWAWWLYNSTWIAEVAYLMVFTYGRGWRLLWNLNHMLNRLLPALWVAAEQAAAYLIIPWRSDADDSGQARFTGAQLLMAEMIAAAAAGFGMGTLLAVDRVQHEQLLGDPPPVAGRCSVLCFREAAVGQPRWAPSAAVRRALLRGLLPPQAMPPATSGEAACERMANAERARDLFAASPFPDLPWANDTAAGGSPAPREIRAVILDRDGRRRFGPDGIATLRAAIAASADTAGWKVAVHTPPAEASGNGSRLSEQARPFIGADVLIAASGAGLSWAFLLAPGSAVLELAPFRWCSVPEPGLNLGSARRPTADCFGGLVRCAGLNHVGVAQLYAAPGSARHAVNVEVTRVHPETTRRALAEVALALRHPETAYGRMRFHLPESPLPNETDFYRCRLKAGALQGPRTRRVGQPKRRARRR
eukprot:TRINITY_DN14938_c0_g2_i2.p1 TRINITY_DN14938_c0_g2~~TRINITY_DN14938_c0_g2_i2.p1  ORF type:complete len:608 (+),score=80.35 TRINITY_DN14938_c0_g2_i2:83-1906(+)